MTDLTPSANRIKLCGRMPILMIYQGHQGFPPESVIKKPNQIAFSHCCMVVIRFHFLLQSPEFYWLFVLVLWEQKLNTCWWELLVSFPFTTTDTIYFEIYEWGGVYQFGTYVCSLCLKKKDAKRNWIPSRIWVTTGRTMTPAPSSSKTWRVDKMTWQSIWSKLASWTYSGITLDIKVFSLWRTS